MLVLLFIRNRLSLRSCGAGAKTDCDAGRSYALVPILSPG